jgi:hypothetical protein
MAVEEGDDGAIHDFFAWLQRRGRPVDLADVATVRDAIDEFNESLVGP